MLLVRIGYLAHILAGRPAERHAHQRGAVAVAPADVRRRLLMRHQAEIRSRILVAEGGDGGRHPHQPGDCPQGIVREFAVGAEGDVTAVFHQPHMDVHAAAGLAHGDFGGEGDIQAALVGQVADDPFGQQQLVGGGVHRIRQELYLVLLVNLAVQGKVAHLAVAVFDLAAGFGHQHHAFAAEVVQFCERLALVVALLVGGGEILRGGHYHIVFQLAHRLEFQSGALLEGLVGPLQGCERGALERRTVFGEVAAQKAQRGYLVERVHKGGAVARNHVQVAVARLDERREQAAAVHPLPFREYRLYIFQIVDGEVQRLDPAVLGGVHEIHHLDLFLPDESDYILSRKILRCLAQMGDHLVGTQFQ